MLVYNPRAARGARGRLLRTAAAALPSSPRPRRLLGLFRFSLRYVSPTLSTPAAAVALQGVACTSS